MSTDLTRRTTSTKNNDVLQDVEQVFVCIFRLGFQSVALSFSSADERVLACREGWSRMPLWTPVMKSPSERSDLWWGLIYFLCCVCVCVCLFPSPGISYIMFYCMWCYATASWHRSQKDHFMDKMRLWAVSFWSSRSPTLTDRSRWSVHNICAWSCSRVRCPPLIGPCFPAAPLICMQSSCHFLSQWKWCFKAQIKSLKCVRSAFCSDVLCSRHLSSRKECVFFFFLIYFLQFVALCVKVLRDAVTSSLARRKRVWKCFYDYVLAGAAARVWPQYLPECTFFYSALFVFIPFSSSLHAPPPTPTHTRTYTHPSSLMSAWASSKDLHYRKNWTNSPHSLSCFSLFCPFSSSHPRSSYPTLFLSVEQDKPRQGTGSWNAVNWQQPRQSSDRQKRSLSRPWYNFPRLSQGERVFSWITNRASLSGGSSHRLSPSLLSHLQTSACVLKGWWSLLHIAAGDPLMVLDWSRRRCSWQADVACTSVYSERIILPVCCFTQWHPKAVLLLAICR